MVAVAAALTKSQKRKLDELEQVIEAGLQSFVDVGKALLKIRESGLYVEVSDTWEGYCKKRWNFSRQRAHQLVTATEAVENVSKNFDDPPKVESHAAALAVIDDPEDQVAAWQEVVETAPKDDEGNPKVTAAHVASVASQYVDEEPEPKKKPNVIGALRERIGAYLNSAVNGQPAHVRMAVADYLEELAQELRA
jgi:hypothetical protein